MHGPEYEMISSGTCRHRDQGQSVSSQGGFVGAGLGPMGGGVSQPQSAQKRPAEAHHDHGHSTAWPRTCYQHFHTLRLYVCLNHRAALSI